MKMIYIPLEDCVDRAIYKIKSQNLSVGVFRKESKGFIGIRHKFGDLYLFQEFHYDTGAPFGTVTPEKQIGMLPEGIDNEELEKHEFGTSFALFEGKELAVIRRDLRQDEVPHGDRIGFVDEWADTKERLPDNIWPYVKENQKLTDFLMNLGDKDGI